MKKTLLGMVALAVASSAMMTTANAGVELDPRGYVGVDYKYYGQIGHEIDKAVGIPDVSDGYANGLGLTAGVQLNDYIGAEASYNRTVKSFSAYDDLSLHLETITVGITGQYPIVDNFYAKALVGAEWGRLNVKAFGDKTYATTDAEFIGKVGVGYQIDTNNVLELTYNRELNVDGLGLQYKFIF